MPAAHRRLIKQQTSNALGVAVSVGLHGLIVVAAFVDIPFFDRKDKTPPVPIDIEFIQISDQTTVPQPKAQQPDPIEEQPEIVEPVKKTTAQVAPAPAQEDVMPTLTPTAPAPDAVPDPVVKPKPKPKPQLSEAERERRRLRSSVTPRSKPKPPSRLDRSRLAALIDRSKKEEDQRVLTEKRDKPKEQKAKEEAAKQSLFAASRARLATADLQTALKAKLAQCWNIPLGAEGIEEMSVTVRISLREDGTLARSPQMTSNGDMSNPFYRVFVESAIQAVRLCEPFDEAKAYVKAGNRIIDFRFDGADYGG